MDGVNTARIAEALEQQRELDRVVRQLAAAGWPPLLTEAADPDDADARGYKIGMHDGVVIAFKAARVVLDADGRPNLKWVGLLDADHGGGAFAVGHKVQVRVREIGWVATQTQKETV